MPSDAQKARERAKSLLRAWDMLQIIRRTLEASKGEALPVVGEKSITKEAMLIAEHLAKHLCHLHRELAHCQKAVEAVWNYRQGTDLSVGTHSARSRVARMEVKTDAEISDLARIPHTLAEEIEKLTGETLYHRPTMKEIERMLFPRRDSMREIIQRRRNA